MFPLYSQSSTGRSTFLVSNESPYFSHLTLKFQLQIYYTLEVIAENVRIQKDFLMYFHNSLIPSVTYLFFAAGEKIKSNLEVKIVQNVS